MASVAAEAHAAAPAEAGKSRVALILAVAAIVTAGLGTRAELLASSAGDDWHASGTLEAKRMAAMLNDASLVYLGDAPAGVETLRARVRAEALQAAAAQEFDPTIADALSAQALVESELAKANAHGGPLAEEALQTGTFDVGRRLAAKRGESPELVAIDPGADFRHRQRRRAQVGARAARDGSCGARLRGRLDRPGLPAPAATAARSGRRARGGRARRGRRRRGAGVSEAVAVDLVEGLGATQFRRRLAVLVGAAALIATLLGLLQHELSGRGQRESARSTRLAAQTAADIAASELTFFFRIGLLRDALTASTEVDSSLLLAQSDLQRAQLRAEGAAARQFTQDALAISRPPTAASGLDGYTLTSLTTSAKAQLALSLSQAAASDRAARYGRREGRATLGLSLAAIAGSLLGLAGVFGAGRGGSIALGGGAVALVLALAAGATALV